jgi:hypothetical protein
MGIYGADVHTTYQAGLGIESLALEGYDFCIVKATQGSNGYWAPDTFDSWQERIRSIGMINGAYHWCTSQYAKAQVTYFLNRLGNHKEYPIIQLDIATDVPIDLVREWVDEWNIKTDHHPLFLYPEKPTRLDFNELSKMGLIWDSHYVEGSGYASVLYERVSDSWWRSGVGILQFTSQATAGGIIANVDANMYQGTKGQLLDYVRGEKTVAFQPGTPPTDQEIADLWNWWNRGTAAFGGDPNGWHIPKQLNEIHAAVTKPGTVTLTADDRAEIVNDVLAGIGNSVAEQVITLLREQLSK